MAFFSDGSANGGFLMRRRQILCRINELCELIDGEREKREELLREIERTDRQIERFSELVSDMEALLG